MNNTLSQTSLSRKFYESLRIPFYCICFIWGVHLVQLLFGWDFGVYGVLPRRVMGLRGILFSPAIHGDFAHLLSNSVPLFALFSLIIYFYPRVAIRSFIMIYLLTGLAVWGFADWLLAGSEPIGHRFHIGASGVVYGLVTFLLGNGLFRRNLKSTILALIVLFFYSGIFVGVLPNQEGISWESHLFGAFVGLFTSFYYRKELESDEEEQQPFWEEEPDEQARPHFLPRDAFDKTRAERAHEAEELRRQREEGMGGWTSSSTYDID